MIDLRDPATNDEIIERRVSPQVHLTEAAMTREGEHQFFEDLRSWDDSFSPIREMESLATEVRATREEWRASTDPARQGQLLAELMVLFADINRLGEVVRRRNNLRTQVRPGGS